MLVAGLSLPACSGHESPSDLPAQHDASHPDSEQEMDGSLQSDSPPSGESVGFEDVLALPAKLTPWGSISGSCGSLGAVMTHSQPGYFENTYTFSNAFNFDPTPLDTHPYKRFTGDNAGGSSICSEVMSMQLLIDCEGASIYKGENEITYIEEGSKADYVAELNSVKVGVSVTRAYLGPGVDDYSVEQARALLEKKLEKMNKSLAIVTLEDRWSKQLIHLWTLNPQWAQWVKQGWEQVDERLKGSAILWVTVEQGSDLIVTEGCTP